MIINILEVVIIQLLIRQVHLNIVLNIVIRRHGVWGFRIEHTSTLLECAFHAVH